MESADREILEALSRQRIVAGYVESLQQGILPIGGIHPIRGENLALSYRIADMIATSIVKKGMQYSAYATNPYKFATFAFSNAAPEIKFPLDGVTIVTDKMGPKFGEDSRVEIFIEGLEIPFECKGPLDTQQSWKTELFAGVASRMYTIVEILRDHADARKDFYKTDTVFTITSCYLRIERHDEKKLHCATLDVAIACSEAPKEEEPMSM
jgi:hypothetical protein